MNNQKLVEKMCEFIKAQGKYADEMYVSPKQDACDVLQSFCDSIKVKVDLHSIAFAEEIKIEAQTPYVHQALQQLYTDARNRQFHVKELTK